jgi:predicted glycosyltransferase
MFVPFEGDGETEQLTRARAFQARFGAGLIREADLSAEALAREAARLRALPAPRYTGIGTNGVARTVALAEAAIANRGESA